MNPYDEQFVLNQVGPTFFSLYQQAGRVFGDDPNSVVWPSRVQYDICAGMNPQQSLDKHVRECMAALGLDVPPEPEPEPGRINGRLRAIDGHLENDLGPLTWHGISEFDLIHLARNGRQAEVIERLDHARSFSRNVVRVFAMAKNLFDLNIGQSGYWDAAAFVGREAAARGLYIENCLLPDAQLVYPGGDDLARVEDCEEVVRAWIGRFGGDPVWTFQAANEPYQNGFESATDSNLIYLGEVMEELLGHRDFSIGDAPDGESSDATQETINQSCELARHCNIIVLHSSRTGGAEPADDGRLRRWADHLKVLADIMAEVRKVNPNAHGIHDEPMGHASQQWVPIPGRNPYEREYDPQAALAAAATAMVCRTGYTYHRIYAQDPGCPGLDLIRDYVTSWPSDPAQKYLNDSWEGSPTRGFTGWAKVRNMADGITGHTVASGVTKGSITFANGYQPQQPPRYDGSNVQLIDSN